MQTKLTRKQAWSLVKLVFPEYTGRKFKLETTNTVWFHDTNWGGGTKNSYAAIKRDGQVSNLIVPAPWVNFVEGTEYELPNDVIVIEHTRFQGKDLGITIYVNPTSGLLEQGKLQLTAGSYFVKAG